MSTNPPAQSHEGVSYLASLDKSASERVLMEKVTSAIEVISKGHKKRPMMSYTKDQMQTHRQLVACATKNSFVRKSLAWLDYLTSAAGEQLEDARHVENEKKKATWQSMMESIGGLFVFVMFLSGIVFWIVMLEKRMFG